MVYRLYKICSYNLTAPITSWFPTVKHRILLLGVKGCRGLGYQQPTIAIY